MACSFTFCGVDAKDLGLIYAPSMQATNVYVQGQYDVNEEYFAAHDGGYHYGQTVKPKDFELRCIFEDTYINDGILSRVSTFFKRGRTGKLVFDKRDWLEYTATVIGIDMSGLTNKYNGMITIRMRAYYPFARCKEDVDITDAVVRNNSGLIPSSDMPAVQFTDLTDTTSLLLYHGGTENAAVAIEIAGDTNDGVKITNKNNGQTCVMTRITAAETTDAGKYVVCDGLNGKTILTDGETGELKFIYHDAGFITLEPSFPIERDVSVTADGSADIVLKNAAMYIDKYVYLNGQWLKITDTDKDTATLSGPVSAGEYTTNIVTMNEIIVEPVSHSKKMNLTKLNFRYKHTFM